MMHYLVENPWPLLVVEAAACALFGWRYLTRRVKSDLWLALAAAGLLALHLTAAKVVDTTREQVTRRTHSLLELAESITSGNSLAIERLKTMFSEDAMLRGPDGEVWATYRQAVEELDRVTARQEIENHRVMALTIEPLGDGLAEARMEVRTMLGGTIQRPVRTQWQVRWRRPAAQEPWVIESVQWMEHPLGIQPRRMQGFGTIYD